MAVSLRQQTFGGGSKEGENSRSEIERSVSPESHMLWKWAWSRGTWRVAGLSLNWVGLWEDVGLRPWACLRSGCAVGSDQWSSGAAWGPRTEGAHYARLPRGATHQSHTAELNDPPREWIRFECPISSQRIQTRTTEVLPPTPSFPGSNAGGVNSSNLQVERGAGGVQNKWSPPNFSPTWQVYRFEVLSSWWWEKLQMK